MSESPFLPSPSAWVDESVHTSSRAVPIGFYILVAAIAGPTACEELRAELRLLLRGRSVRLHWRNESEPTKRRVVEVIGAANLKCIANVGRPIDNQLQERARRKCLKPLLIELMRDGVEDVHFESRGTTLNKRDVKAIDALRGEGAISRSMRIDFESPLNEPMLWVPDAVAGVVGAARKSGDRSMRDALDHVLVERIIDI